MFINGRLVRQNMQPKDLMERILADQAGAPDNSPANP
jgi:hypothetical protein